MAYWHADTPDNVLAKSYQAIFDKLMYLSANSASYRYWSRFYFAIGKWRNLLVRYSVDGCEIFFPSSHHSPFVWKTDPQYSKSLGRIAAFCTKKFPNSVIVDIGANIGDTAAIIRSNGVRNTIVCVEGVRDFFDILSRNADRIGNIVPVHRFVGPACYDMSAKLRVLDSGNAVVYEKPEDYKIETHTVQQANVEFETIDSIVQRHAPGSSIKLLKTDIEGYDLPVLISSLDLIGLHKPLIYLELHISDIDERSKGVTWKELWEKLSVLGYNKVLYWYCSSAFLCMLDINRDDRITEDIHDYIRNRGGYLYYDVCMIHKDDGDLATAIYNTEKVLARESRDILKQ